MNEPRLNAPGEPTEPKIGGQPGALAAFELDSAKYLGDLDGMDITEAQKVELLETLWSVMRSFVELGFSVDLACEQLFAEFNEVSTPDSDGVESLGSTTAETPSAGDGKETA